MAIEHVEAVPGAGDLQRYPTSREIVGAALAQSAALAAKPTRSCPNYAVPCEDLDGNPHRLVVVALGGRIALIGPGGVTAVLDAEAVGALGDPLEDILVAKVHGGEVRTGDVEVAAKHEVFISEKANVSVIARPYTETVELNFEFLSARLTCYPTLDQLRALTRMLADAETTMLGWHQSTNETANEPPTAATEGCHDRYDAVT